MSKTHIDIKNKLKTAMIILLILSILVFLYELLKIDFLPSRYLVMTILVLTGLFAVVHKLFKSKKFFKIAAGLSAVIIILSGTGSYYLHISSRTLKTITGKPGNSIRQVELYARIDDPIENVDQAALYEIGILKSLSREDTENGLKELKKVTGKTLQVIEYKDISDLADSLEKKQVGSIFINPQYLALLDETGLHDSFQSGIKKLWEYQSKAASNDSYIPERYVENTGQEDEIIEKAEDNAKQEEKTAFEKTNTAESITNKPFIVYISGNDNDGKLLSSSRSDVNLIAVVNPDSNKILLVNTPRDYYVTLAGIKEKDKLTHAGIYGVETSIKTLENLYNIDISYYVRLNFTGFKEIIDAIGGITVESEVDFQVAQWHFKVGKNKLSGIEALAFARERYSFAAGDIQRGKNQQAVLKALINKLSSPKILTKYDRILKSLEKSIETNIDENDISELVKMQLDTGKKWDVETISAGGTGSMGSCYSMPNSNVYRMIPDEKKVKEIKKKILSYIN